MDIENKIVTLKLEYNDVGQILDGICVRRDSWRNTQKYFEEGYIDSGQIIEDCNSGEEAKQIADYYDKIIQNIGKQIAICS